MNDSDDAPPMLEVVDCSHLVPCPPRTGPWPQPYRVTCACCRKTVLLAVETVAPLSTSDARADAIVRALSGAGWVLLVDGEREDWICGPDADAALDPSAPVVAEAIEARRDLARIAFTVEPGAGQPGWRGRR